LFRIRFNSFRIIEINGLLPYAIRSGLRFMFSDFFTNRYNHRHIVVFARNPNDPQTDPMKKISFASLAAATLALSAIFTSPIQAQAATQDDASIAEKVNQLAKLLEQQSSALNKLESKLSERDKQIEDLRAQLDGKEKPQSTFLMSAAQAAEEDNTKPQPKPKKKGASRSAARSSQASSPQQVGEAPRDDKPPEVPLLANVGGVLTPYGHVTVEPFIDYARSSVNTFTFQGNNIVAAFLIGQISAARTARDIVSTGATVRAGLPDRFEVDAKVPFVARQDAFTNTIPSSGGVTNTNTRNGYGLGDIEFAGHYQINNGQGDWPFFVGNLRYKSDTGRSPYEVPYNDDGTASYLPTGSGFNAVQPSLTMIYPTDPAVLFANLGYTHSFGKDINKSIAGNAIGSVEPGDTYSASLGMGIALNDRLSFTLGYAHDHVRPTITQIAGVAQRSDVLEVGSALTGASFKVNENVSVNVSLAAGVTNDAPDAQVSLRVPVSFNVFGH
jgi:hypothetical protein